MMLPSFGCCTFDCTDDAPSTVHVVRDLLTAYEEVATLAVGGARGVCRPAVLPYVCPMPGTEMNKARSESTF